MVDDDVDCMGASSLGDWGFDKMNEMQILSWAGVGRAVGFYVGSSCHYAERNEDKVSCSHDSATTSEAERTFSVKDSAYNLPRYIEFVYVNVWKMDLAVKCHLSSLSCMFIALPEHTLKL